MSIEVNAAATDSEMLNTCRRSSGSLDTGLQLSHFNAVNAAAAQRFFAGGYSPGWVLTDFAGDSVVTHQRCAAGPVTVDEVEVSGRLQWEIRGGGMVVVIQPQAGALSINGKPIPTTNAPVLITENLPCTLEAETGRFAVVTFAATLLRQVLTERKTPPPRQIRFESRHPHSDAGSDAWRHALEYLKSILKRAETDYQPLVLATAANSLAAATLECFSWDAGAPAQLRSDTTISPALRDALSFIDNFAGDRIRPRDVAAAVRLTPRAVQYLFRQQLGTTPTEYLRSVRLQRAHRDLLDADSSTATVAQIALRCGFAHPGRFSILYRETYGHNPRTSLQR